MKPDESMYQETKAVYFMGNVCFFPKSSSELESPLSEKWVQHKLSIENIDSLPVIEATGSVASDKLSGIN